MNETPVLSPPLPLLITGIAGVSGYNAFHYFRSKYPGQVFGIRQKNNWRLDGPGILPCDIEDTDELQRLFDHHQFQAVINGGGSCALKSCELDPQMAWRINLHGVRNLLSVLENTNTRVVHLSIDLVFSGTSEGDHLETDITDPVTVYGKTMTVAENLIQLHYPQATMLRISLPMGVSFNGHAGAIDWIQSRFAKQKPATLFYDEVRTPTYTDCLNRLLEDVISRDMPGLYHGGGPIKMSLYEIAQVVNRVGGYRAQDLMGCYREEAGPMPPRAGDVSMDSSKLIEALGYNPFDPWPHDPQFIPTHKDWHLERPTGENGSPELLQQILYRNPNRQG
ncbi:MAG: SDR family oxidoreductase [Pirellulales bacterium]|jgi:dTDP-4-dehydrorhamnose reductase